MSLTKTLKRRHGATPPARAKHMSLCASALPRLVAATGRLRLYTLAVLSVLGMASTTHAQVTETVLYSFTGGADGTDPGSLRADTTGPGGAARALYGTALGGGEQNANCAAQGGGFPSGCGTAFRLTAPKPGQTAWTETSLWSFTGGKDQYAPSSALAAASNRIDDTTSLYGITLGDVNAFGGEVAQGSVFSLTGASLKTIWTARGYKGYSAEVTGPVAVDSSGAVYAAAGQLHGNFCGAVEKLTPPDGGHSKWTRAIIYDFVYSKMNARKVGCTPAGLRIDETGALYGVLTVNGPKNPPCNYECGAVFKLTPPPQGQTAWTEQTIKRFSPGNGNGSIARSPPFIGKDGKLYGATVFGGNGGCGTVYILTPPHGANAKWREDVIFDFPIDQSDGCGPDEAPIVDKTGAVFGTTTQGGRGGRIYKLTPPAQGQTAWTETNLLTFSSGAPIGPLVADQTGTLYGATYGGGADGKGSVFSLTGTGFVPK